MARRTLPSRLELKETGGILQERALGEGQLHVRVSGVRTSRRDDRLYLGDTCRQTLSGWKGAKTAQIAQSFTTRHIRKWSRLT